MSHSAEDVIPVIHPQPATEPTADDADRASSVSQTSAIFQDPEISFGVENAKREMAWNNLEMKEVLTGCAREARHLLVQRGIYEEVTRAPVSRGGWRLVRPDYMCSLWTGSILQMVPMESLQHPVADCVADDEGGLLFISCPFCFRTDCCGACVHVVPAFEPSTHQTCSKPIVASQRNVAHNGDETNTQQDLSAGNHGEAGNSHHQNSNNPNINTVNYRSPRSTSEQTLNEENENNQSAVDHGILPNSQDIIPPTPGDHHHRVATGHQTAPSIAPSGFQLFKQLPIETVLLIFGNLEPAELGRSVAPVCRQWRHLAADPTLWGTLRVARGYTPYRPPHELVTPGQLTYLTRRSRGRLRRLCVFGEILTAEDVAAWSRYCPNLTDFTTNAEMKAGGLRVLVKNCPLVQRIHFDGTPNIDMNHVKVMDGWRHLRSIDVSHCSSLDDDAVRALVLSKARPPDSLEHLNVDGVRRVKNETVRRLLERHGASLRHLYLDGGDLSEDAGLSPLAEGYGRGLRTLSVSVCAAFDDTSLEFIEMLNNLTYLRLQTGTNLTEDGISNLFRDQQKNPKLRHLNMSDCPKVTTSSLMNIAHGCGAHVTHLALQWCNNIGDSSLHVITDGFPKLETLDFHGISTIQGFEFKSIPRKMPNLTYLHLQYCNSINREVLNELVIQKPDLKIRDYYGEIVTPGDSDGNEFENSGHS